MDEDIVTVLGFKTYSFAHDFLNYLHPFGPIAQWSEQLTHNQKVLGSSPSRTTYNAKAVYPLAVLAFSVYKR